MAAMTMFFFWLKDLRGSTAIEYALIAAGISVAISVVVFSVGTDLAGFFQALANTLGNSVE